MNFCDFHEFSLKILTSLVGTPVFLITLQNGWISGVQLTGQEWRRRSQGVQHPFYSFTGAAFRSFSPLPRPFPTYDRPSGGGPKQHKLQLRLGLVFMPLPRHRYIAPPPDWLWPGRDAALMAIMNYTSRPLAPHQGPAGPSTGLYIVWWAGRPLH